MWKMPDARRSRGRAVGAPQLGAIIPVIEHEQHPRTGVREKEITELLARGELHDLLGRPVGHRHAPERRPPAAVVDAEQQHVVPGDHARHAGLSVTSRHVHAKPCAFFRSVGAPELSARHGEKQQRIRHEQARGIRGCRRVDIPHHPCLIGQHAGGRQHTHEHPGARTAAGILGLDIPRTRCLERRRGERRTEADGIAALGTVIPGQRPHRRRRMQCHCGADTHGRIVHDRFQDAAAHVVRRKRHGAHALELHRRERIGAARDRVRHDVARQRTVLHAIRIACAAGVRA